MPRRKANQNRQSGPVKRKKIEEIKQESSSSSSSEESEEEEEEEEVYVGQRDKEGLKHGRGTSTTSACTYEGRYKHGLRHGRGKMTIKSTDDDDDSWMIMQGLLFSVRITLLVNLMNPPCGFRYVGR